MSLGEHARLPVGELRTFHKNPRKGDVEAIAGSLRVNNQYRPIVVNRGTHTGRPNEVLAGNHTLMAARSLAENDEAWNEIDAWGRGCRAAACRRCTQGVAAMYHLPFGRPSGRAAAIVCAVSVAVFVVLAVMG